MQNDPYGQPQQWQRDNPYAPPSSYDPTFDEPVSEGTYWGGFAAGFLAALIGLLLVYLLGKSETKRGALHGFLGRLGLVLFVVFVTVLFG